MSNLHRIIWFDHQVRGLRYPNSASLSKEFEISRRQALRDIEYMINSMGAPLVYHPQKRGYEYSETTYILPHQIVTETEKRALGFLAYRYRQFRYENSSPFNRLAGLFKRLAGEENSLIESFPFFDVHPYIIELVHIIDEAIKTHSSLIVQFFSRPEGALTEKRLEPVSVLYQGNIDYLVGYASEEKDEIWIELECITSLSIGEETEIQNRRSPLEPKPFKAQVKFSAPYHGTAWFGYPIRELGNLLYEVEFFETDCFLNKVLGSGGNVLVLKPEWAREKMKEKLDFLLKGYD